MMNFIRIKQIIISLQTFEHSIEKKNWDQFQFSVQRQFTYDKCS